MKAGPSAFVHVQYGGVMRGDSRQDGVRMSLRISTEIQAPPAAVRGVIRDIERFTMRRAADVATPTGEDGRFRISADSLLFTPDDREHRPPVRFRYAWLADGMLALTDAEGHVWSYVRQ